MDFPDPNPVGSSIIVGDAEHRSQIQLTNVLNNRRRLVRAQKNPMDKCTVVSIFPKAIDEQKITIEPGKFHIPAGTFDNPATLVVGSSSYWKDIDLEQPMLEIVVSSIQVANSIVVDYCNSLLASNMSDSMPGLFFVMGALTPMEIKMKFKEQLLASKAKQNNWYTALVKLGDSLWARTGGNSLAIMDEMRLAAKELNLNDKPWLKDYLVSELVRCNFCGGMRNPAYPICPQCKAIDPTHPLAKEIKFAV